MTAEQLLEATAKAIGRRHHSSLSKAEFEKTWKISEGEWCEEFRRDARAALAVAIEACAKAIKDRRYDSGPVSKEQYDDCLDAIRSLLPAPNEGGE